MTLRMMPQSYQRRRRPDANTLSVVLGALSGSEWTPRELARTARIPWRRVCAALNALVIHGAVEVEAGKYRRVESVERQTA